jgi:glycosyltransferase involved in cell wall biosynthesis
VRIALVNNFFFPRVSGSAHLTEMLAAQLAARGHDVVVLTSDQRSTQGTERRNGYDVVRYKCRALPEMKLAMKYDVNFVTSPSNVRRIFGELDRFDPQLIHQHGQFFDLTWISALWARRRRVPTALTVHTALTHTSPPYAGALWLADQLAVRPFMWLGQPVAIAVDRFMLDYVRRRYHLPRDRIRVLPLAVDVDRFRPADGLATRERLGIGRRPMVLSIGHVIPLRDRLALVEALPRLIDAHPEVAVVVVGEVYDNRFLQRARQLGVAEHIVCPGAVPYHEVPDFVSAADIESHDLQGYGLGTASLEVMASGVPVVSVVRPDNFPGLTLRNWENVVMVPPEDPATLAATMARLLADPELAGRVGAGQREFIRENFSLEHTVDAHLALYEELVTAAVAPRQLRTLEGIGQPSP